MYGDLTLRLIGILAVRFYKKSILFNCFLFSALLSSVAMADDKTDYAFSDCPMQIGDTFLDEAQGSCSVYKHGNNGGATLSVIAYDQNLVVWGSVQRAGSGRFYKHSNNKQTTKKYLENWPYIKDNGAGIRAASPRTTYVGDDLKVVLYEIDLRKEKNCIGFSKGYGNTEGSQGGSPGATDIMSVLACPINVEIGTDKLLAMIESIEIRTKRW